MDRRNFLRFTLAGTIGSLLLLTQKKLNSLFQKESFWQIDPATCQACGLCRTECVLSQSAARCFHAYKVCGYCDLCSGYLRSGALRNTGAENQLCPTGAIERSYIEDPYYEYIVHQEICTACGRCIKGCRSFGNGSLFLQIRQDLCLHCHRCSIEQACPYNAISPVGAENPYRIIEDR